MRESKLQVGVVFNFHAMKIINIISLPKKFRVFLYFGEFSK